MRGAQNVPNIKPGILEVHPRFREYERQGVFVRDSKSLMLRPKACGGEASVRSGILPIRWPERSGSRTLKTA